MLPVSPSNSHAVVGPMWTHVNLGLFYHYTYCHSATLLKGRLDTLPSGSTDVNSSWLLNSAGQGIVLVYWSQFCMSSIQNKTVFLYCI